MLTRWLAAACRPAALAALLLSLWPAPSLAQSPGSIPAPPVRDVVDENGVDVSRGSLDVAQPGVSIGPAYPHGLAYTGQNFNLGWQSNVRSAIFQSGTTYTATVDGASDSFALSGGVYTPTEAMGATLTLTGGTTFTYTARNGLVATFARNTGGSPFWDAPYARATSITYPDGTRVNYWYKFLTYCPGGVEGGICPSGYKTAMRLQSVTNNHGYQLKLNYASNTLNDLFPASIYDEWSRVTSVVAINNAQEYCSPSADTCSLTGNWPTATYGLTPISGGVERTVTDPAGLTTRYTSNNGYQVTAIRYPGSTSDDVTVSYGANGVSSITRAGVTHGYSVSTSGTNRTTTVTDPASGTRTYVTDTATYRLLSFTNELGWQTTYDYDASNRLEEVVAPEGNKVHYTRDGRGNVTQTQAVPKSGSGDATITTSASYPGSCTNTLTCNQPATTTDARGQVTDYTYDTTHGGVLTVTAPAPTTGADRPQTRYSYTAHQAYYKDNTGSIVASGTNVYLLTGTSACSSGTSPGCVGTANESRTVVNWGPQSAGTANNLLPVSSTARDGTGALAATSTAAYDTIGNLLTVDGPLSGTADTTTFRYDANRRQVGAISPDPDGGGVLLRRAQRTNYAATGLVSSVDVGTVTGTSDPDWAAFSTLQTVAMTYDGNRRLVRQALVAASATQAVRDLSYDALGRPQCSATRMNPAAWGTLTGACTLQTTGTNGPDRISRAVYNLAGQATQSQVAYGTADQANAVTTTYRPNGQVETVADGEGRTTQYVYDGQDRRLYTVYPDPATGAPNASDYERFAYDANGNVTGIELRDHQVLGFSYDNLNRVTLKDLPGTEPNVTYGYDLLNRITSAVTSAQTLTFTFDALGRNLTQVGPQGTTSYAYDVAGRRTRLTWPGAGLYVDYDHLVTGEVTAIRENGATSGVGMLATYAYDNLGRRTLLTRGNGTTTTYTWDNASRLQQLVENAAGTAHDQTLGFSYNPAGQLTQNTRSNDSYAWTEHYNVNRGYTPDGLNRYGSIATVGGSTITPTYDTRGNMTSAGAATYGYTSENLLTTATGSVTLAYDPLTRLYQTSNGVTTTRFAYDGAAMIAEYNASNTLQRRFVHGPGVDEPIVWYEGTGTSDRRWLHADERGSIVAISDTFGTAVVANTYNEYGIPAPGNVGRFGYTGQAWIPEIGMWYYRARIYSPTLGRFMQTDPIGYGDGMNLYAYVGNDPVNAADPSGLCNPAGGHSSDDCELPIIVTGDSCSVVACIDPADYLLQDLINGLFEPLQNTDGGGGSGGGEGNPPCLPPGTQFESREAAGVAGVRWSHANNPDPHIESGGSIEPHRNGGWTFAPSTFPGTPKDIPVRIVPGVTGGWYHNHTFGGGERLSRREGPTDRARDFENSLRFARRDPQFATVLGTGRDQIRTWTGRAGLGGDGRPAGTRICQK